MPKLVYFGIRGRAQSIRLMLHAKGVEFEDERLTFEQWGPIKAAGTYGEGVQMPVYINDDGKIHHQSMAILKMLAHEHGYMPETASQQYEADWFYATIVDTAENKPEFYAMIKDDADEEAQDKAIAIIRNFTQKVDAHLADGRAHVAGDKITHADFELLSRTVQVVENPGLKHQRIKDAMVQIKAEATNIMRVLEPMRELCASGLAAMPTPAMI